MTNRLAKAVTAPLVFLVVVALFVASGSGTASAANSPGGLSHPGAPHLSPVAPDTAVAPEAAVAGGVGAAAYADTGVLSFGDASYLGGPTAPLSSPLDGMAADPKGAGYWLFAADGGVFAYGAAAFYGSAGSISLYAPIVGMAATADGKGYWLVAADGGIFSFGDAGFYGSMGDQHLNWPITGMAAGPNGHGYWMVAGDGGIFAFGNAAFEGSAGSVDLPNEVVGMASTADSQGYWLVGSGGSIYPYGDAKSYGDTSKADPAAPVDAIARSIGGQGYWLLEPDAFPVAFSHPDANSAIVANAATQIQANPDTSRTPFCNPYGPCEEWCALFAMWTWESAGVDIPRYAFVGDIYNWARDHTEVLAPSQTPASGDAVLYGTGPQTVYTAVHVGIVAQVWPDGAIDTIEGDAGPGPWGDFSVVINGPYLPAFSDSVYNGTDIFGYAVP